MTKLGVNKKEGRADCCWFSPGYNKQDPCRKHSFCLYGKSQNSTHNHISSFNEQILWFLICESQKCVVLCLGVNRPPYPEILSIRYSFPSVCGFSVCTKRGNVFLRLNQNTLLIWAGKKGVLQLPTTQVREREREEKNKQLKRKQISEGSWHWLYHNLWRNLFQLKDTIEGNYWYFLTLLRLLLLKLITRLLADVVFKIQCRYVIFIFRGSCC